MLAKVTPQGNVTELLLPSPNGSPFPVVLGADGNIYVSETATRWIDRVSPDGTVTPVIQLRAGSGASPPHGGIDGSIGYLRLANGYGFYGWFNQVGDTQLQSLYTPSGVAFTPDGSLWRSEFNADGTGHDDVAGHNTRTGEQRTNPKDLTEMEPTLLTFGSGGCSGSSRPARTGSRGSPSREDGALEPPGARAPRREIASSVTAARRTAPVTMYLTAVATFSRSMPLEIEPMTSAPSNADQAEPRPPKRLVPPITAAAMAFSSRSLRPTTGSRRAASMLRARHRRPPSSSTA